MTVIFDENGHATEAGVIRVYHYVSETGEYWAWSDEFIPVGVSIPGNATLIYPGEDIAGYVWVFDGSAWVSKEDHRDETVYSTATGVESAVDYIGDIKDGFTTNAPITPYDKWDGKKWVTDTDAQHTAAINRAENERQQLIKHADTVMLDWRTELMLGEISDNNRAKLSAWLAYKNEVKAVNVTTDPEHVNWLQPPKE